MSCYFVLLERICTYQKEKQTHGGYELPHLKAKHYEEPSEEYGIEGGRISKLFLKQDGAWVANYDRGWDMEPTTEAANPTFAILMHEYN